MRRRLFAIAAIALLASAGFASIANAADHRDSPLNQANPAADINDVYAFRSGANPNDLVIAISVNPLIAPGDNAPRGVFDNAVNYQIHIDGNGDLKDDATVKIHKDGDSLVFEGLTRDPISAKITPPNAEPIINTAGPIKVFAGLRDDPFFFDLAGFQTFVANPQPPVNGLRSATGGMPTDSFAGTNIMAIVVELPVTSVSGTTTPNTGTIKAWVSTAKNNQRIDRMAIPAINTALIPTAKKDAFNQGDPSTDATSFRPDALNSIKTLRGVVDGLFGTPEDGGPLGNLSPDDVAGALIPDIVTIDFSKPLAFPNGRGLSDDVINAALGVVLNRGGAAGISDGINGNDEPFLSSFPYLAPPHTAAAGAPAPAGAPPAVSGSVTPPNTGDAGLLDANTSWTLSAALFILAVSLAGAGVLATMRSRGR